MKRFVYLSARALQLFALLTMPSAIWVAELDRNEAYAITIFTVSLIVFCIGFLLLQFSKRL